MTDQFKFNLKMAGTIDSAKSAAQKLQLEKVKSALEEREKLLNEQQKHILLADKSEFGWCIVDEYKQHDLADDSDNEKQIYSAERHTHVAIFTRKKKKALPSTTGKKPSPNQGPVASSSSQPQPQSFQSSFNFPAFASRWPNIGTCFACGKPGHWQACSPAMAKQSSPAPKWLKEQDLSCVVCSNFNSSDSFSEVFCESQRDLYWIPASCDLTSLVLESKCIIGR